ncbi:MAG: hypothetical protein ACRBN8_46365 [Nannocystales bacterium]
MKPKKTPRHTTELSEFLICKCGDPFCDGTDPAGKLKPRRPADYIEKNESGTFRAAARARIDGLKKRRRRYG